MNNTWTFVTNITSSTGTSTHRIEQNENGELRCTCQSFRIHGKGQRCKHTDKIKKELGLEILNETD